MARKLSTKAQTMREISELLGLPEILPTRGSTVPAIFFSSIAAEMGIPVVNGMPRMARKIIESAHLAWSDKFSSEVTPSGGGGTVTAVGLLQVKNAILIWQGKDAEQLPDEFSFEEWSPSLYWKSIRDSLPRELKEVTSRPGADEFRELVLMEYDYVCAISGCRVVQAIEVAHIVPYYGPDSDNVQNAIPMRVDLHRLFDKGLIRIEFNQSTRQYLTQVHDEVIFDYDSFKNKPLILPKDPLAAPSKKALEEQHILFNSKWTKI